MLFPSNSPIYYILLFPVFMMLGSSYKMLLVSGKLFPLLKKTGEDLSDAEQKRLDNLLATGRNYHLAAFVLAGILLALSTLDNFGEFLAPFGNIRFPSVQTALGLFVLVIVLLIATDYIFLMAYPWFNLDKRRPPFDWLILGFDFQKNYPVPIWMYLPLLIASIGMVGILNKSTVTTFTTGTTVFSGFVLMYFPRTIYYLSYFIERREDHRGGSATLSIYLLYVYRYIRQIIYTILIAYPIVSLIPAWKEGYEKLFVSASIVYTILFVLKSVASVKRVYRWIDRRGKRFGFPIDSKYYA